MTTLIVLVVTAAAVAVLAAAAKVAVRLDGYGRHSRTPPSRWPDVFDPPAWRSPQV